MKLKTTDSTKRKKEGVLKCERIMFWRLFAIEPFSDAPSFLISNSEEKFAE